MEEKPTAGQATAGGRSLTVSTPSRVGRAPQAVPVPAAAAPQEHPAPDEHGVPGVVGEVPEVDEVPEAGGPAEAGGAARIAVAAGAQDAALAALFTAHHASLIRLAVLLCADDPEDIVAEAFYQLFRRWGRLRNEDAAVAYVRSVVCNLTRMRIRHLQVARRHVARAAREPAATPSIEAEAVLRDDQRALIEALTELSARQREALVLRYWMDLREPEIAAAMGISVGAVKVHVSRGMASLTRKLEEQR